MENYKEKYEQAMFRMNKWVEGSEITDPKEVAEFVFPELKESEDEKIRKELIETLKQLDREKCPVDTYPYLDWAAWLEKQGEPKPTDDNVEAKFKVGDTIVEKDDDECGYETIKDIKNGQYIFTDGYCMNIDEQEGWQLVKTPTIIEQKPAWSEEDEVMVEDIIEAIDTQYAVSDYNEMVDWLKSLKERNTWKPSDEQIEVLYKYAEQNNHDGSVLTSLYQDLKKLK